jgi:hypothetical protein
MVVRSSFRKVSSMCGQDTYQLYRYPKACRACRCPRRIASASVKPVKSPVLAGVAERGSPLISATRRRPACTSCSSHRECSVSTGGPNRSSSQRRRLSIPFTNSSFSMRRGTQGPRLPAGYHFPRWQPWFSGHSFGPCGVYVPTTSPVESAVWITTSSFGQSGRTDLREEIGRR